MDTDDFWQLIERARDEAGGEAEAVAERASELLSGMPPEEIIAAQRVLWDQLAVSYTAPLWAAAYVINGGCSDDGFDYFRGWLVVQGRETFEAALADPESLAGHAEVQAGAAEWEELECERTLGVAYYAYQRATGEAMPRGTWQVRYPALGGKFWFDFSEDGDRLALMLPRLTALRAG